MTPKKIVLSGSMKHYDDILKMASMLSTQGHVVLMPFKDPRPHLGPDDIEMYRKMHEERILIADEMTVVNPGGYIGYSVAHEIQFAKEHNKPITYLVQPAENCIVTMIGSHKFIEAFLAKSREFALQGKIVFIPAIFAMNPDTLSDEEHEILDKLHQQKMLMSDEVFVVNPGGYIGGDTKKELEWAKDHNLNIRYMVAPKRYEL